MRHHRGIHWLVAFGLFCFSAAPAGADTVLHLAEGVTIAIPDDLPYVARTEAGAFVRTPSGGRKLPSDAEMNDDKRAERLLVARSSVTEPGSKIYLFSVYVDFIRDPDDPARRAELAKKRRGTLQELEKFAAGFDEAFSTSSGFQRLSISGRKIDDDYTLLDYRYREQADSSNLPDDFTVRRFITIFGPDGTHTVMISYPGSKAEVWSDTADRITNSIAF